jgi:hypothetical protein
MILNYRFSDFEALFFYLYIPQLHFLTRSPVIMNLVMNVIKNTHTNIALTTSV